jgi:NTE family protein
LQQITLFHDLPEEDLARLAGRLRVRHAPRGTVICRQGESSDAMYILASGQVKVVAEGTPPRTLDALGPGAVFGELALLTGAPRSATVVVSIDADLWVLAKDDFDIVLRSYPTIAVNLSRSLAAQAQTAARQHASGVTTPFKRLIGVVGTAVEALGLARRVPAWAPRRVLVLEVIDTGDENSTVDPDDPFADVVPGTGGVDRLVVPVELSSGDFGAVVSHLLREYDHLLVRLPERGGRPLAEALELCDAVILVGQAGARWTFRPSLPPGKIWSIGRAGDPGYDAGRGQRDQDRLARRIAGRTVGLALGSGGAHGLAHLGVISVLEQAGIPIDLLSGTSMGSVIASAYAVGHRGAALYRVGAAAGRMMNAGTGWRTWDFTLPRSGLVRGNITRRLIAGWTRGKRFEDCEIPVFIVAAALISGRAVVFSRGSLAGAVRASVSITGFFEPVPYGDDFLVDGAAVDPVPCRPLAGAGADIIIACSVIPPLAERRYRGVRRRAQQGRAPGLLEVFLTEREITSAQIAELRMHPYDVLVAPQVGVYTATDAARINEFVRIGEAAARKALPQIQALLRAETRPIRRVAG